MSDTDAFQLVATRLEEATSLTQLEARGTIRLMLKEAGFRAASVTPRQMEVVVEKLLPHELRARGVEDETVCSALCRDLGLLAETEIDKEAPDDVFARLNKA